MSYKSSLAGSSTLISRWATKKTSSRRAMASSSALMDLGRPTSKWVTMPGKTARPRRGSSSFRSAALFLFYIHHKISFLSA